jgi:hypothetical protein
MINRELKVTTAAHHMTTNAEAGVPTQSSAAFVHTSDLGFTYIVAVQVWGRKRT